MWRRAWLVPDHKTMGDFHKDNGAAICNVCARFIMFCWALDLLPRRGKAAGDKIMHKDAADDDRGPERHLVAKSF